ncbi:MAG: MBL fold metallo-hydrolase [Candidatus Aenigmatarchaeota archaeon]
MINVNILVQGYAKELDDRELATSTTTLIIKDDVNILVDPGMNRDRLLESLQEKDLSTGDIDYIILTHHHLDHSLLAGIFENAKVLDDELIYSFEGNMKLYDGDIFGGDIEIIQTPGHDPFHCSVVVRNTEMGTIVVAGDVFWWSEDEEQRTDKKSLKEHEDPYAEDREELRKSMNRVLKEADYIIPGHGEMFEVRD